MAALEASHSMKASVVGSPSPSEMPDRPELSAIVCTRNRAGMLANALESLLGQTIAPNGQMEILVVDNASSDGTREVVSAVQERASCALRYLYEDRLGLSRARNAGVAVAHGRLVAFMDDDAVAEPDWAHQIIAAFAQTSATCVGGKVVAHLDQEPPGWLPERVWRTVIPSYDLGDRHVEIDPLKPRALPWGGNMAIVGTAFQRYGGFREDLGLVGTRRIACEDTELCLRLMRNGGKVVYWPRAVVHHAYPESRLSVLPIIAWAYDRGRDRVRLQSHARPAWREACSAVNAGLGAVRTITSAAVCGSRADALLGMFDVITEVGRLRGHFARAVGCTSDASARGATRRA